MDQLTATFTFTALDFKLDGLSFPISGCDILYNANEVPEITVYSSVDLGTIHSGAVKVEDAALESYKSWYQFSSGLRGKSVSLKIQFVSSEGGEKTFSINDWILDDVGGGISADGSINGVFTIKHPLQKADVMATSVGALTETTNTEQVSAPNLCEMYLTALEDYIEKEREFLEEDESIWDIMKEKILSAIDILRDNSIINYESLSYPDFDSRVFRKYASASSDNSVLDYFTKRFFNLTGLIMVPSSMEGAMSVRPYAPFSESINPTSVLPANTIEKLNFPAFESSRSISGTKTFWNYRSFSFEKLTFGNRDDHMKGTRTPYPILYIPNKTEEGLAGSVVGTSAPAWLISGTSDQFLDSSEVSLAKSDEISEGTEPDLDKNLDATKDEVSELLKKWLKYYFFSNYRSSYKFNPKTCLLLNDAYLPGTIIKCVDENGSLYIQGFCQSVIHHINLDRKSAYSEMIISHAWNPNSNTDAWLSGDGQKHGIFD